MELFGLFFIIQILLRKRLFSFFKKNLMIKYNKYNFSTEGIVRTFSYKRLFNKMIDLDMTNNELMKKAKVSKSTFYKMKNGIM